MSFIIEPPSDFEEITIDGIKAEFAFDPQGPTRLYWMRYNGQIYYVTGEFQVGREAKADIIVWLNEMRPGSSDKLAKDVMKKLILKYYYDTDASIVEFV